jgi:hypothetical protein
MDHFTLINALAITTVILSFIAFFIGGMGLIMCLFSFCFRTTGATSIEGTEHLRKWTKTFFIIFLFPFVAHISVILGLTVYHVISG